MFKIGHFSDLHASEKTKQEALKILGFIFERCAERNVHAILNTGDTFDGPVNLGENGPVTELIDLLSQAPAPLYVIQGTQSHDIPGSIDIFSRLSSYHGIKIFREPDSFPMILPGKDQSCGHISFLPALSKSYLARDITASPEEINQIIQEKLRGILAGFGAEAADSPKPHILVAHFTVTGSETSTGQIMLGGEIQLSVADLALANADYVALGHMHKAQQPQLPPHIHYAGSPYHLNFGELEDKGFKIITFDDDGKLVDVEFIETPSRPRQVIDARWNSEIRAWDLSENPCPGADVRIRLHAPQHEMDETTMTQLKTASLEAGVHSVKIETIPTTESRIRAAELADAQTIREELAEYGRVKGIEVSESAMAKADHLEEVIA